MERKDDYRTLGLDPEASNEQIKQAYRRLARRYHPDLNREPNAEARFKAIDDAYRTLKAARYTYDHLGSRQRSTAGSHVESNFQSFNDFFCALFAGARPIRAFGNRASPVRGSDLHLPIRLSLEEAYGGVTLILRVDATGRRVSVRIPSGARAGQQFRLAQQGNPGTGGGPRGDLLLEVKVAPHPRFRVRGRDVLLELPITPWEAALGARLKIPTLGGEGMVTLPPGVQSGHRLRLTGRGLPGPPAGDQLVILRVQLPPASNPEAVRLYRKMAEVMPFDPRTGPGL